MSEWWLEPPVCLWDLLHAHADGLPLAIDHDQFLHARSNTVVDEYKRRGLLGNGGKLRVSASTSEELAQLLRKVLEAESAARSVDHARLQQQQQQQAEQDSNARSRRARRNRGSAASAIARKARAMSTDN